MKNIQINEENVEIYQKLHEIKSDNYSNKNKKSLDLDFTLTMTLVVIILMATFLASISISSLFPDFSISQGISFCISVVAGVILSYNTILVVPEIIKNYKIKKIKKEYPDLDTDVDINELEKELQRYIDFTTIPKDIIKQKEECISTLQSNKFKEMSNEEKIAFLEQSKNIIIQFKQYDEFTQEKSCTNEEKYQKKLGSIK